MIGIGEQLEQMPPEMLAEYATSMVEDTMIKVVAKRGKEDGRITHLLVAITDGSRRLLDGRGWVEEEDYRETVQCFEELPLSKAVLSSPAVVTLDEWRCYADGGPLSRSDLEQDSQWNPTEQ
jgi:hypothetical protein